MILLYWLPMQPMFERLPIACLVTHEALDPLPHASLLRQFILVYIIALYTNILSSVKEKVLP